MPALAYICACIGAVVFLAGCQTMRETGQRFGFMPAPPPTVERPAEGTVALQPLAPVRRDIFTRSYRIGEPYTAHANDIVISVKNYSITEKVGRATALRDFAQQCTRRVTLFREGAELCEEGPLADVHGALGGVFDVAAAVTVPDGQYFAVALPTGGSNQVYLLVDPTGRLRRGKYVAWRENLSPGFALGRAPLHELEPGLPLPSEAPLFSFESVERFIFMGPGYLSFDVVFLGTRDTLRGELITFSYREFGRDSTDRPSFERTLQFPVGEPVIEVGPLRMEVEPVGYNDLRFRVIADGQPAPTSKPSASTTRQAVP